MKKLMLLIAIAGFVAFSSAQAIAPVNVAAKGTDVRDVLTDLFAQVKKNFVAENLARQPLYLSLTGVDFEEALQIVCKLSSLKYELQNGIFYVTKMTAPIPVQPAENDVTKPKGKLPAEVLARRVTTKFAKTPLKDVLASLAKQAGLTIEVDASVPAFKVDAFLVNTSLKYALDILVQATNLQYRFTENRSIQVFRPDANRVAVVDGG